MTKAAGSRDTNALGTSGSPSGDETQGRSDMGSITGLHCGQPGARVPRAGRTDVLGNLKVVTNAAALRSPLRTMGVCTPTADTGPCVELLRGCKTSLHVLFPIAFLT